MVKKECPKLVRFTKTKLEARVTVAKKFYLGYDRCLAVDSMDQSGGVALLWNKEIDLSIKIFSGYHIHAFIEMLGNNGEGWFLIGLYGHPEIHYRHITGELLKSLRVSENEAWLIGGDLNEIKNTAEKWEGSSRSLDQIIFFQETVDYCNLSDLGYLGSKYTWCNNKEGSTRVYERLDRYLANPQWIVKFPKSSVSHGVAAFIQTTP